MSSTLFSTRVLFQFPDKRAFLENIAVRSNGDLVATRIDVPQVWIFDSVNGAGSLLLTLPDPISSVTGITELSPDVFAIGAGQYDLAKGPKEGSWEVWVFSLTSGTEGAQSTLQKICAVPNAGLLNGITTWDSNTVLGVDSSHGTITKVNISAGTAAVVLQDKLMTAGPDAAIPIGINGVKVRNGYVYFTNTGRASFYRVPINGMIAATGPVAVLASGFLCDDFAFDTDGTAYIVTHPQNTVVKVAPGSPEAVTVAGVHDSLEIGGPTSCAFGRREEDKRVLYVVTSGAKAVPVNGKSEAAKVVAIDLA